MKFPPTSYRGSKLIKQISCARGDTICPAPLLPRGRPSTSRAAEQTQRSSSFPRGHAQYVFTVTAAPASRVKVALSNKPAW